MTNAAWLLPTFSKFGASAHAKYDFLSKRLERFWQGKGLEKAAERPFQL